MTMAEDGPTEQSTHTEEAVSFISEAEREKEDKPM